MKHPMQSIVHRNQPVPRLFVLSAWNRIYAVRLDTSLYRSQEMVVGKDLTTRHQAVILISSSDEIPSKSVDSGHR
jgi:hypothetical protein